MPLERLRECLNLPTLATSELSLSSLDKPPGEEQPVRDSRDALEALRPTEASVLSEIGERTHPHEREQKPYLPKKGTQSIKSGGN